MSVYYLSSKKLCLCTVKDLNKKPGIWILVGKEKGDSKYVSLQVAQSGDIGPEITRALSYLKETLPSSSDKNFFIDYVNQFGEKQFSYENYNNWRMKKLYNFIFLNYDNLHFICLTNMKELNNKDYRTQLEKYLAYKTICKFWANGGSYKPKSKEEIVAITTKHLKECEDLYIKLSELTTNTEDLQSIENLQSIDDYIINLTGNDFE